MSGCYRNPCISFDRFLNGTFRQDGIRLDWGAGVKRTQLKEVIPALVDVGILVRKRRHDQLGGDTASSFALHLRGEQSEPGPKPTDYRAPAAYAFTPVPNQLFDVLLPHLKEVELKAALYITHHTSGIKKRHADISRGQMLRGTVAEDGRILDRGVGVTERSLDTALRGLAKKRVIFREERRAHEGTSLPTRYGLNVLPDTPANSELPTPANSGEGSPANSELPTPANSEPHERHVLKTHEREIRTAFRPFASSPLDSRQVWAAILPELQTIRGADSCLSGSRLVAREDGELVVGVSSAYAAEWLGRRLAGEAARQLSAIGGEQVGVRFVAASQYQPAAATT